MQGANLIYTCLGQFDKPDEIKISDICKNIKAKSLFNSNEFVELSPEFKFFLKLAHVSPTLCILCYKSGIYWRVKSIKRKFLNGFK